MSPVWKGPKNWQNVALRPLSHRRQYACIALNEAFHTVSLSRWCRPATNFSRRCMTTGWQLMGDFLVAGHHHNTQVNGAFHTCRAFCATQLLSSSRILELELKYRIGREINLHHAQQSLALWVTCIANELWVICVDKIGFIVLFVCTYWNCRPSVHIYNTRNNTSVQTKDQTRGLVKPSVNYSSLVSGQSRYCFCLIEWRLSSLITLILS